MMRRVSLGVATVLVSGSLLVGGTRQIIAECGMEAPPRHAAAYRGRAFIGTVTASETIDTQAGKATVITIDVERELVGDAAETVRVMGGTRDTGCHHFRVGAFDIGDRLLLSFKPFDEAFEGRPEGVVVAWRALAWVPTKDGGWRFMVRGVTFPESDPARLTAPDTLREIMALVRPSAPPPASTEAGRVAVAVPVLGIVVGAIGAAVGALSEELEQG